MSTSMSVYKLYSCARRFVFLLAAEFLLPDHLVSLTTVFNSLKENTVSHKDTITRGRDPKGFQGRK